MPQTRGQKRKAEAEGRAAGAENRGAYTTPEYQELKRHSLQWYLDFVDERHKAGEWMAEAKKWQEMYEEQAEKRMLENAEHQKEVAELFKMIDAQTRLYEEPRSLHEQQRRLYEGLLDTVRES